MLILIPSLITFLSLLFALLAISKIFTGDILCSFTYILLAFSLDIFDGYLARRYKCETEFGKWFDSLSDIFVYLIYPSTVVYIYLGLSDLLSLILLGFYNIAGIYRLLRFPRVGFVYKSGNIGYSGLPVFVGLMGISVIVSIHFFVYSTVVYWLITVFLFMSSVAMVQSFYFPKPKKVKGVIFFILALSFLLWNLCIYGL